MVIVVNANQTATIWLSSQTYDLSSALQLWWMPVNWIVLAQHIDDPDLLGQIQRAFDNFIQTGQVWAMLIGFILGYIIRGLTTYG